MTLCLCSISIAAKIPRRSLLPSEMQNHFSDSPHYLPLRIDLDLPLVRVLGVNEGTLRQLALDEGV